MQSSQLQLKYSFRTRPRDLFIALSRPEFMQNWFAEKVVFDEPKGLYTFNWGNYTEYGKIVKMVPDHLLKWEWSGNEREAGQTLSFQIQTFPEDEYIDLIITDHCEPGEEKGVREEWDSFMESLEKIVH